MDIRVRDVPTDLHIAFKMTCTARQVRQNEVILRLVEEFIKREKVVEYKKK
jgi:hypothetical protein